MIEEPIYVPPQQTVMTSPPITSGPVMSAPMISRPPMLSGGTLIGGPIVGAPIAGPTFEGPTITGAPITTLGSATGLGRTIGYGGGLPLGPSMISPGVGGLLPRIGGVSRIGGFGGGIIGGIRPPLMGGTLGLARSGMLY